MRLFRKSMLSATVLALSTAAVVTVTAQPAQAQTYTSAPLTAWAYTDAARPTTADPNPSGDAPIGASDDAGTRHVRRAYFTFDITAYRSQILHRATLYSSERTVRDCTAAAPIEVWRTKPVTATTTWAKAPKALELVGQYTLGKGIICPGAYLGIDVIPAIEAALDRREKTITFEVRVAASAENDLAVARTMRQFALSTASNHAPVVSAPKLLNPDRPCGTLEKHPFAGGPYTRFNVQAADADGDYARITYATWPVAEPEKRVESTSIERDLREFPDGTVIAWQAQARDNDDAGPWSRTCYLTVDNTAPAKAPVVFSKKYNVPGYPGSGGQGVAGAFVFDAEGDRDIVSFEYRLSSGFLQSAKAGRPGGRARVELTPANDGRQRVEARSVDRAGNRGPFQTYEFWVRDTAPFAEIDVAGVNLTSHITLGSRAAEATSFGYALNGGTEVRVAVVDGKGTGEIVFPSAGSHTVALRAYAGNKLLGADTETVRVSDAPGIASEEFNWLSSPLSGEPGSFRFTPRTTDVVAYRYEFDNGEQGTVDAGADGTAVLEWTPQDGRYYEITVVSVRADGSVTEPAREQFFVISTKPYLSSDYGTNWPDTDGVGRPVTVSIDSDLPGVTGFVYSFDGGAEKETTDGAHAYVDVVPRHAGENTFTARARRSDGTLSPAATLTFTVTDAPVVDVKGPYGQTPMIGREATFTIAPAVPGIVGYRYNWGGWGEEQQLAADADGNATLVWTPESGSYEMLVIYGVTADGTVTESRTVGFGIDDQNVSVSATWSEWWPSGGMGVPGRIGFHASPSEATKRYLWRVGDGPMQAVDRDPDALVTDVPYTPDSSGELVVQVQREFVDGVLSTISEHRLLVGTMPLVEADRLQDNQWNGEPGEAGVFRFSGGTTGIVSYDYRVEDYTAGTEAATGTVAADGTGAAQVSFTPAESHYYIVTVTGRTADGTVTDQGRLSFSV
ncbi:hypothetical protein [Actinoplanes sp. GCM10030250]|uniref:hypothetical protein n=1 Tax=Actinoplanes sp. GCM10030250 TaxID=3273376 RepID=UPI00360ECAB6